MLTTLEIVIYGFVVLLLPIVIGSLVAGSPPPQNTFLTKYYNAEKYLNLAGNLFLLTVIAIAVSKLVAHFGLVDAATAATVDGYINVPFLLLLVVFLALWVRAALKVRGEASKAP
jgi:predicted Na+-dependent transporter